MLPQNHRELYRKALALSSFCDDESKAARLTYTILDEWLRACYPDLISNRGSKKYLQNPGVQEFANELCGLPFIEAAFWLSCGYSIWVGKTARKEKAMFFTPPKLAEHVIDTLIEQGASLENDKWFDPACGGAAFIVPLALKMRVHLVSSGRTADEILDAIEQNIVGIDIDNTLQNLTKFYLQMITYQEMLQAKRKIRPNIRCINTLSIRLKNFPKFDVLLCNPPYRKLVAADRENILAAYLPDVEGQHNLYAVFMTAALLAAKKDSLLALLTPTSYMSGLHFSKLRSRLTKTVDILQLDMLTERDSTFVQVEQETAILYGRRNDDKKTGLTSVFVLTTEDNSKAIGEVSLSVDGKTWYVPRSDREFQTFHDSANSPFRLTDYGYIAKIGPLVWNRDTRKQLFSEDEVKSAKSLVPVVWSSNITANGEFHFGRSSGQKDYFNFVDFGDSTNEGLIRSECVVLQRVTSTDQLRRLVAAVIPKEFIVKYGHFVAENHVVTLIPKLPKITPEQLKELLMAEPVDLLFRCLSGTVGVTIFELNQLPLPDPKKLKRLLQDGKNMADAVATAYEQSNIRVE